MAESLIMEIENYNEYKYRWAVWSTAEEWTQKGKWDNNKCSRWTKIRLKDNNILSTSGQHMTEIKWEFDDDEE